MKKSLERLTFTVPIGGLEHQQAERFSSQQANSQKIKQVYLNTLAVSAVNFYLSCLGIETDLLASESWNPVMQYLLDVADLSIPHLGKLECRPLLPGQRSVYIPPEVWFDRIGYVVVDFNKSLSEATLLGFLPTVDTEEVSLDSLRSLTDLIAYLDFQNRLQPVRLSSWLAEIFENGWQTIETLLHHQPEIAFNFRSHSAIQRGKLFHLEPVNEQVVLFVGLQPTQSNEVNISVEVYPSDDRHYLPENLKLFILDEQGDSVMEAIAKNGNKNIQFELSGEVGEQFIVKLSLGDFSIAQAFLI